MKKYYFFITALIIITSKNIRADDFARALADLMLAEKTLLSLYRNADPKDRPALETQMLRAGIAPEVIKAEPIVLKPVSAQLTVAKPADTTELTDTTLADARKKLKPTTTNPTKTTFAHRTDKPSPEQLQERMKQMGISQTD